MIRSGSAIGRAPVEGGGILAVDCWGQFFLPMLFLFYLQRASNFVQWKEQQKRKRKEQAKMISCSMIMLIPLIYAIMQ